MHGGRGGAADRCPRGRGRIVKRALVTGGTRGIGLSCVRLLRENGYAVTALYARDEAAAAAAARELPDVRFVRADVSDRAAVEAVFSSLPALDLLVNNAGVSRFGLVQDVDEREFDALFSVNVKGTFLCTQCAVRAMVRAQRGAIVNVSSVWGQTGASCESVYSASKGAVIAFTKALAKELAPSNITVNCVAPGVIETDMNARLSREARAALREEIPAGRFGTPEEVARAVLFLAEAPYVTGQVLGVNGGFYL